MRIIGVDPDSKAHGIAIYETGILIELVEWSLMEVIDCIAECPPDLWVVEDVNKNKFIYSRNDKSGAVGKTVAQSVGMVRQSGVELVRALEWHEQNIKLIPPNKGNWANNKALFERLTGWQGKSNVDTRSAAYFGYLYAAQGIKKHKS